jgi:hypothetical protein
MKTISIRQTSLPQQTRAAQVGQSQAKSEAISRTPAPRSDQRRVFWLFFFSFLLVLVYGGCAKRGDLRFVTAKAEKGGDLRHAIFRTELNRPATQINRLVDAARTF